MKMTELLPRKVYPFTFIYLVIPYFFSDKCPLYIKMSPLSLTESKNGQFSTKVGFRPLKFVISSIAFRKAKIEYNFGLSECKRVNCPDFAFVILLLAPLYKCTDSCCTTPGANNSKILKFLPLGFLWARC